MKHTNSTLRTAGPGKFFLCALSLDVCGGVVRRREASREERCLLRNVFLCVAEFFSVVMLRAGRFFLVPWAMRATGLQSRIHVATDGTYDTAHQLAHVAPQVAVLKERSLTARRRGA